LGDVLRLRMRAPKPSGLAVAVATDRLPIPVRGEALSGVVFAQITGCNPTERSAGLPVVTSVQKDIPANAAYEALAPFYDRFTAHHDYELWTSGLLMLAYAHGLTGNRVLDAGCGTGKSFLPLLHRGFEVTACDHSGAMLDVAAAKAGGRVRLYRRDLRALDRLGEFDLITCLDDVANYLTEPGDLAAALAGLGRNLRRGGVLLFDANTLATYRSFFRETAVLEEQRLMMIWRGLADERFGPGGLARASLDIFSESDGRWSRTPSRHNQRHHARATVNRCIERAGLRCLAVYGQDPAVNFEAEVDELRHTKAIYVVTR
jgi:SAM-dependent methyltransferase